MRRSTLLAATAAFALADTRRRRCTRRASLSRTSWSHPVRVGLTYAALAAGKPFLTTGVIANKGWADANPPLVRRFAGVVHQCAQWANRNPGEAATLIAKLMQMDLDVVKAIRRVQWGESSTPALVQPVIDMMARYGVLARRFPGQELFAPGVS